MDENTLTRLRQARNLLRAGERGEAHPILVEILKHDANCEPAWYMLSYTLTEDERKIYAIKQVLRINPDNEKAKLRLTKLASERPVAPPGPVSEPGAVGEAGDDEAVEGPAEAEIEEQPAEDARPRRRVRGCVILAITVFVLLLVAVLVVVALASLGYLDIGRLFSWISLTR